LPRGVSLIRGFCCFSPVIGGESPSKRSAWRHRIEEQSHFGRHPLEQDLEAGLECGDPQAIKAGFELLADNAARPAAAVDLVARLREDGATLTLADWLASQPAAPSDPAAHRIEARLDELTPATVRSGIVSRSNSAGHAIRQPMRKTERSQGAERRAFRASVSETLTKLR
jgi:hypothetical protein